MTYLRAQIEQCPAFGWQGGPNFKTLIVPMENGMERRNGEWAQAQHSFTIPFQNIKQPGYRGIKQMHMVCRGRLHVFQFLDQLDHEAANEIFDTGNGVKTVFQLRKISTIDGVTYARNVYIPSADAVITDNGTPVSPTIDHDRGTVTFGVAPLNGHVLRWSDPRFLLWVRFDQDNLPFSLESKNADGSKKFMNGSVSLLEMPPPAEGE